MQIEYINSKKKGCFKAVENGIEAGHMNYRWSGKDRITIYHTKTFTGFTSRGIGKELVMYAAKTAREKKFMIVPECPFAKSIFDGTPEIQDVLYREEGQKQSM